jgi:hypothetical protein
MYVFIDIYGYTHMVRGVGRVQTGAREGAGKDESSSSCPLIGTDTVAALLQLCEKLLATYADV